MSVNDLKKNLTCNFYNLMFERYQPKISEIKVSTQYLNLWDGMCF